MPLRKVRSRGRGCRFSGSKGGLAEEDHSEGGADRGGQNQARYPEIAHKNLPEQPELTRNRGVPLQRLWGLFAPRQSAFISCAVVGLAGAVIWIWERGAMHKGEPGRELVDQSWGGLDIEPLPA